MRPPPALVVAAGLMALFIAGVVVLADTANLGFLGQAYSFPYGDKVGHFVLYGLLSLLINLAAIHRLADQQPQRLALFMSAGLGLVISVEELSQIWLPSRAPDWFDLAAGFAGVIVFAVVAIVWTNRRRTRTRTGASRI